MSEAETIKKITIDVVTYKPISQGEIAIAIDLFRTSYIDRPDILVGHSSAIRGLYKDLPTMYSSSGILNSFMGLEIQINDAELAQNEWRVRKEDSKTYALAPSAPAVEE